MASEIPMEVLERPDIQALILRAYGNLPHTRYYFLKIEDRDAFKTWLAGVIPQVTNADSPTEPGDGRCALNIAFTRFGLSRLGVTVAPKPHGYDGFGLEFRQGLVHRHRSRFLGDVDENDPRWWEWGGRTGAKSEGRIDCLCLLFGDKQKTPLDATWRDLALPPAAASVVHVQCGYLSRDEGEHFGFRDGISQPTIRFTKRDYETTAPRERALHVVEAGEFILGYENQNSRMPVSPGIVANLDRCNRLMPLTRKSRWGITRQVAGLKDFGRNGTYLVLRQLRQYVGRFEEFVQTQGGSNPELLGARIVGRWKSGAPLTVCPAFDRSAQNPGLRTENSFVYDELDRYGYRCPVGAHIRRGNPRDATSVLDGEAQALKRVNFHRLIRRGRLYGDRAQGHETPREKDAVDRGLMFLCLNADLRRQFEFVQQSWVNNDKFSGLIAEQDPLIGPGGTLTVQRPEGHQRVGGLQRFVTVKGGAYFFMPGIQALYCLAGR